MVRLESDSTLSSLQFEIRHFVVRHFGLRNRRTHSEWQDLANFRPLGDCFLWAVFWKLYKWPTLLGYFLHGYGYASILTKLYWASFWAIFSQSHLVTSRTSASAFRKSAKICDIASPVWLNFRCKNIFKLSGDTVFSGSSVKLTKCTC
jgi:hypothetical protein